MSDRSLSAQCAATCLILSSKADRYRYRQVPRLPAEAETVDGAKADIARSHTVTKMLCR
jgi:hypothetical protein